MITIRKKISRRLDRIRAEIRTQNKDLRFRNTATYSCVSAFLEYRLLLDRDHVYQSFVHNMYIIFPDFLHQIKNTKLIVQVSKYFLKS